MQHVMKKRALLWTAGALGAAVLVGAFAVYSYNLNRSQGPEAAQQIVSDVPFEPFEPFEPAAPQAPKNYQYILRATDGKLAVFLKDQAQPEMVFDVPLRVLPEYDQRQLEKGIYVEDYQALVSLIEDYIS